jgi:hypothetical protein
MNQTPRSLADLFKQYLHRRMTAGAAGLNYVELEGQVVPHEAVPVQPVDPRLAWNDAVAVVQHFPMATTEARWDVPPDWPALVAVQEPAFALAFSIGNFPQLVRNLHPLLGGGDPVTLRSSSHRPVAVSPSLLEWAIRVGKYPQILLAAGVLRLARRFDEAAELLHSKSKTPAPWQAVRANEEAALAWHRGQAEEALAMWQTQEASVPVLFNRGMAAIFLNCGADARRALSEAVAQLPDTSAWHHLGHLYLTLVEARS